MLNKLVVGLTYQIVPKVRIDLGPTFNLFLTNTYNYAVISEFNKLSAFHTSNPGTDNAYLRTFIGLKLAVKFF
jgi:hypothetical protein